MQRPVRLSLVILGLLGFISNGSTQPPDGPELLQFVLAAHRSSRESIRTCSCRMEFQQKLFQADGSKSPKMDTCSGQFWYSPDALRAKTREFGKEYDMVWENSVRNSISRAPAGEVGALRAAFANRYTGRCDAWTQGLLVLNIPGTIEVVPFETLVENASRVQASHRTVQGRDMIVVILDFGRAGPSSGWQAEVQFDPSVNYLVRRNTYDTAAYHRETEVQQFKAFPGGIFFPERVVGSSGGPGNPGSQRTVVFSEIKVNEPLPDGIFRLAYPRGIMLTDDIRGTAYRVDEAGNRISDETPMGKIVAPPPLGEAAPPSPSIETKAEPKRWTRWILPGSAGILLIGLIALLARRRLAREEVADEA